MAIRYVVAIRFQLGHLSNSTAEAYNVSVPFYFPPYIAFESVSSCSNTSVVSTMMVDSAVYFNVSSLLAFPIGFAAAQFRFLAFEDFETSFRRSHDLRVHGDH